MNNNYNILLIDNRGKHLEIIEKSFEGFSVETLLVSGGSLTQEIADAIDKKITEQQIFIILIDLLLTEAEEKCQESGRALGYSGLNLAFSIYEKYQNQYGKDFVISIMSAYARTEIFENIEKDKRFEENNLPTERTATKANKNLPFYLIKKPIYNNQLIDNYPTILYGNIFNLFDKEAMKSRKRVLGMKRLCEMRLDFLRDPCKQEDQNADS